MRWVSQRELARMERQLDVMQARLHDMQIIAHEAQRSAATCQQLLMESLKRPLETPQIVKQALEPLPIPEPDDLDVAIELQAKGDRALARHLSGWAKKEELEGKDKTDIMNRILHWQEVADWDGVSTPPDIW